MNVNITVDMSTQASSIDCTIKLPLRGRLPATIIWKDSPSSTWINFLKHDVYLFQERVRIT
jgi:hypothetical protein